MMIDPLLKYLLPPLVYPIYPTILVCLGAVFLFRALAKFNAPISSSGLIEVKEPKESAAEWEEGEILESPSIRDPADKTNIICYDPSTGRRMKTAKASTREQVKATVVKAREAQKEFAKSSFASRRAILNTLLDWLIENQDLVCRISARDSGKTCKLKDDSNSYLVLDATFGDILPTCEKLKWTIAHGEEALKTEYRPSGTISFLTSARVEYHPVGVMGLIISWNYPIHNALSPMISALMAGNACVIKCSEHTAWTTSFLQDLVHSILRAHNVNTDLVCFLNGWGDAGEALVESVDKLVFIGSPRVGQLVMKKASETLTPVILELGGKDAAILFDDCDYKNTLSICMRGALQHGGQNCAGLERMVVQEGIYDQVLQDVVDTVKALRIGSPFDDDVDIGAMTMRDQMAIVQELVDDAKAKGAIIHCGGQPYQHPSYPQGQFYTPTVISNILPNMRIHTEELFGPVLLIYKFKTAQEAIQIVNATDFGLSSSVFSLDYNKAERVAMQLNVGMSNVNGWCFSYLCQSLPFGGVKKSGFDRFGGVEGLRGNCHIRSATTDKFASFGIRTSVPNILQYPISKASFQFQTALIEVLYGQIRTKLSGLRKLARISLYGDAAK